MSEILFKVLVIGDATVGKTSFVHRYVSGLFRQDYKGTIGVDFAIKSIEWDGGEVVKLQLWDIAGQERFTSMTRVYYKNADACVIMFDISRKATFHSVVKWKQDLDAKCCLTDGSSVPCLLLANKCDLPNHAVSCIEIEDISKGQNFLGWIETSVKNNLMVEESMRYLVKEMVTRHKDNQLLDACTAHLSTREIDSSIILSRVRQAEKKDVQKCKC